MLACSDADVQRLLKAMECGEEGATDGLSRRKLLIKAFGKVQQGHKHASSADGLVDPSALPELPANTRQLLRHWETEELFSMMDCILINSESHFRHTDAESYKNAWLVTRRALQAWGFSPSHALPTEPDALRLLSALLAANRDLLPASYVSAREGSWPGSDAHVSFLLPLRPLPADVKLHRLCKVCSKEGASSCSGCGQAAYCSKDCQKQDWPSHKATCKQAQQQRQQQPDAAAATNRGVGDSPHIVADLTATHMNMAAFDQALSGQISIACANELSSKGALRKPNPRQRFERE